MLYPGEAERLGKYEARIASEITDALLEMMVGQSAAAIRQGKDFQHLFDDSLDIYQKALREITRRNKDFREAITHSVRVNLAKSMSNDLRRIRQTLSDLPEGVRADLQQSAATTAEGIIEIVRRDNTAMADRARSQWYNTTAYFVGAVNTGAVGFEQAVRRATLQLADKGIRIIDYASGVSSDADVAIRRHVRTQIIQEGGRRTLQLAQDLGCELVEVTRTATPRPSHARWEGQIYRIVDTRTDYPDFWEGTGYEGLRGPYTRLGDQLQGVNCGHSFSPYDDGLPPMWDDDPFTEQEKLERYEATQEQRRLERGVRKAKQKAHLLEVAGVDNSSARASIARYQSKLRDFVAENSSFLRRDYARERLNGYTGKQPTPLPSGR